MQKAARQVARRYDDALRPLGLTSGQFSILAALLREAPVPLGVLADDLGMDRTTLSRNLKPLERQKLVRAATVNDDRRIRGLALTERGRAVVGHAMPIWQSAQTDNLKRIAAADWPSFRTHLAKLG